jgi:apolipoprotein N-acyltransferase
VARSAVVSACCAFALHLAFPRTNVWWLVPVALTVLFATWRALPPRAAALNGYLCGLIFFTLSFAWFGETAGALLGPFGFIIDLGPSVFEAIAFAAAAFVTSYAARRVPPPLAPLIGAAAFTTAEWMRSSGFLGVPFGQLGLPLVDSPLRPIAAFAGGYGLTFIATVTAAYVAAAIVERRVRVYAGAVVVAAVALTILAWWAWPARTLSAAPMLRVAAVQGNIPQAIKATDGARRLAFQRYVAMTAALAPQHPQFVLWPETVMLTDLNADTAARQRFAQLAREIDAQIGVGTFLIDPATGATYNTIVYFDRHGDVSTNVRKRQLVPFAEFLPLPDFLRAIPAVNEIGHLTPGSGTQVDPVFNAGTLICWESIFGDVAADEVRAGAQFFAVSTDDAWFGSSDGPAQHAQATTLRAVETGRWIVRAASTGISGIIGPDGDWRARSALETQTVVVGELGPPVATFYPHMGPYPIGIATLAIGLLAFFPWRRPRA